MPVSVTVIISTYNMGRMLPEAVQSVMQDAPAGTELIIIDDGSTDNTPAVIENFKNKTTVTVTGHRCSHRGKAACLNTVLQEAATQSEYIVFMDADDLLPPGSLQRRLETIRATGADMVMGAFAVTTLEGRRLNVRQMREPVSPHTLLDAVFYAPVSAFHLNAAILSSELIRKTGLFDEMLVRGQEVEYAIRLLQGSAKIVYLPEVVYHYRKYHRGFARRMSLRLQTIYYRFKTLNKYLKGRQKARAMLLHGVYDSMKVMYELVRTYK